MKVQELVGRRIAEARGKAISQAALGNEVAKYLGKGWASKHAISQAENGHRPLQAEQLLAFAVVLEKPMEWFLLPRVGEILEIGELTVTVDDLAKVLLAGSNVEATELQRATDLATDLSVVLQGLSSRAEAAYVKSVSGKTPEELSRELDAHGVEIARIESAERRRSPGVKVEGRSPTRSRTPESPRKGGK